MYLEKRKKDKKKARKKNKIENDNYSDSDGAPREPIVLYTYNGNTQDGLPRSGIFADQTAEDQENSMSVIYDNSMQPPQF